MGAEALLGAAAAAPTPAFARVIQKIAGRFPAFATLSAEPGWHSPAGPLLAEA